MFKGLKKILEEVPILLVPAISVIRGDKIYTAEGMAIQRAREDGSVMKYTALNYNCDDMVKGLLHETLHHYYPTAIEKDVEIFTEYLWNEKNQYYRKIFQNKIVGLLKI